MPVGVSAYVPLANVTLSSSAASVTFSSISQAYRDLVLVVNGSVSGGDVRWTANNDTTNSNYSGVTMVGNGSTASSSAPSALAGNVIFNYGTGTNLSTWILTLLDYSATDKHKTLLGRQDSTGNTAAAANRWANTAAITSFYVWPASATWAAGSTFALYGVSA